MMEALEKVEKEIKKPLMRSDKKNMGLLLAEFDKINKKYVMHDIFWHGNNVVSFLSILRFSMFDAYSCLSVL